MKKVLQCSCLGNVLVFISKPSPQHIPEFDTNQELPNVAVPQKTEVCF